MTHFQAAILTVQIASGLNSEFVRKMEDKILVENREEVDKEYKKCVDKFSNFQSVCDDSRTLTDLNRQIYQVCHCIIF